MSDSLYNNQDCETKNAFLCRGLCPATTAPFSAGETSAPNVFVLNDLKDEEKDSDSKFNNNLFFPLVSIVTAALLSSALILFYKKRELNSVRATNLFHI